MRCWAGWAGQPPGPACLVCCQATLARPPPRPLSWAALAAPAGQAGWAGPHRPHGRSLAWDLRLGRDRASIPGAPLALCASRPCASPQMGPWLPPLGADRQEATGADRSRSMRPGNLHARHGLTTLHSKFRLRRWTPIKRADRFARNDGRICSAAVHPLSLL
jgi:hypothetical protein